MSFALRSTIERPIYKTEDSSHTINVAGTTTNYIPLKPGFRLIETICDTAWYITFGPKLLHALYYSGTTKEFTEYKNSVTDNSSSTHMPLDGMTTSDYVYLGTYEPAWFYFDIGSNANAATATLDVEYCSAKATTTTAATFTDVAGDSDQTASGGATLAIDGEYVWTKPTMAKSQLLYRGRLMFDDCYWIRFKPSATLSTTVDINQIITVYPDSTNLTYRAAGVYHPYTLDTDKVGGIYAQCTSEKTLYISWMA